MAGLPGIGLDAGLSASLNTKPRAMFAAGNTPSNKSVNSRRAVDVYPPLLFLASIDFQQRIQAGTADFGGYRKLGVVEDRVDEVCHSQSTLCCSCPCGDHYSAEMPISGRRAELYTSVWKLYIVGPQ